MITYDNPDNPNHRYGSRAGVKIHQGKCKPYACGFGPGDVIGCYLKLPRVDLHDSLEQARTNLKKKENMKKVHPAEELEADRAKVTLITLTSLIMNSDLSILFLPRVSPGCV